MPNQATPPQTSVWIALGDLLSSALGFPQPLGRGIGIFIGAVIWLLTIMGIVTYMIYWLRKLVGWMQSRLGPYHVGFKGLLQTPADALKLLTKEGIIPSLADRTMFIAAPAIVFLAAFLVYATIPATPVLYAADLNVGVVYVSAISSITVLGIVLGAWASNNKYALISAFRSAAQIVSYEVPFAFAVLGPVALAGTFSYLELVQGPQGQSGNQLLGSIGLPDVKLDILSWFVVVQPVAFLAFFVAGLAENNVTPFDIVEAESEIVAGFHVEYSGMKFALFFLAEFANTLTLAVLTVLSFFGGWVSPVADSFVVNLLGGPGSPGSTVWHLGWFCLKVFALITLVFTVRAALPRVRVDQLMDIGWKALIPITLANIVVTGGFVALGIPRLWLAVTNWVILIAVLMLGSRKRLAQADLDSPVVRSRKSIGEAVV